MSAVLSLNYTAAAGTNSAALLSSQSIMQNLYLFRLHCSLHSARIDRCSSLLAPPFSYQLFALPQRHRVCMRIPACYRRREGGYLSPKYHWEWHWKCVFKRRVAWRRVYLLTYIDVYTYMLTLLPGLFCPGCSLFATSPYAFSSKKVLCFDQKDPKELFKLYELIL